MYNLFLLLKWQTASPASRSSIGVHLENYVPPWRMPTFLVIVRFDKKAEMYGNTTGPESSLLFKVRGLGHGRLPRWTIVHLSEIKCLIIGGMFLEFGHYYKHYSHSGLVSISNAAFSPCGLLPKLWFANQMNQVCLRFGFYPVIMSLDFAFADCSLPVLWLAVARQLPRLTAETQRQNKYNQNK